MNNYTTYAALRSKHCLRVLLGLGLLLANPCSVAESPELYGQVYVRLGHSWADGKPPSLPSPREGVGVADESAYLEQIQNQEASGGPYADGLAEPLASLGYYYRDHGRYGKALDLFQHAIHLVRINDGLYSERQIPMVRALLDTHRLSGDMQALDDRYDYFFRLYGNGYPPFTPLRLRASLEFLRWQREAFRLELDRNRNKRLADMYRLNERILEAAAQSAEVTLQWYEQLVRSQILNLYLIQSQIVLPPEASAFQSSRSIYSGSSVHSNQRQDLDFNQRRLLTIQQRSAARGRALLQELITRTVAGGKAADIASIHLELGDWNQWNGSSSSAREQYSRVVQILEDAGDTQLLEQWLGSPAELPANGAFWQPNRIGTGGRRVELLAEYRVSARGNARNIQIQAAKPEDAVFISRLRRKLSATLFRPRFATGEAEAVERVSRQYELTVE